LEEEIVDLQSQVETIKLENEEDEGKEIAA